MAFTLKLCVFKIERSNRGSWASVKMWMPKNKTRISLLCWQIVILCSCTVGIMVNYRCRVRVTSRGVSSLFLLLRTQSVVLIGCCLVLLDVIGVCGGYQEQKFAMEPQDQVIYYLIHYILNYFCVPFITCMTQ